MGKKTFVVRNVILATVPKTGLNRATKSIVSVKLFFFAISDISQFLANIELSQKQENNCIL